MDWPRPDYILPINSTTKGGSFYQVVFLGRLEIHSPTIGCGFGTVNT